MRTLVIVFGIAFLVPTSLAQAPSRGSDEAVIRQVWQDYVTTWNKHDAAALVARFFTADPDRIASAGQTSKGRAAVERAIAETMHDPSCKDVTLSSETVDIRLLTNDVAILDARDKLKCTKDAGSSIQKTNHTSIFVRRDGKWLTAAVRAWALSNPTTTAGR